MDRILEKFIMTEFVSNRMDTQEQVSELIKLIATKRGTTKAEAGEFIKKSMEIIQEFKELDGIADFFKFVGQSMK